MIKSGKGVHLCNVGFKVMTTKDERKMEDTIEKLFLDSISQEEVLCEIASRFYETIEDLAVSHGVFRRMLWEYESFVAYFAAESEELTSRKTIFCWI
ncbi:MAG: hypothetical protein ACLR23_00630 [Clostridia bacterium]